jgi:hypothetical protein
VRPRATARLAVVAALLGPGIARADDDKACAGDWTTTVYARAKPSVVRIQSSNAEFGTGFFFGDACHVATALHVVDDGRGLRVTLSDGRVLAAEVVGTDSAHDLALLTVSPCARDSAPLRAASPPEVGSPVMAVGHPFAMFASSPGLFHGLLEWSASTGIVSARGEDFVQTDAAVNPGNSGGPLLDCHGDVVGVADRLLAPGVGFAVSSAWLGPLTQRALAAPRVYSGSVRFTAALGLQFDIRSSDSYQGLSLSGALIIRDRWMLGLRVAYLPWGGPDSAGGTTLNPRFVESASRALIDGAFGPRFLLFPFSPAVMYLQIAAGGGAVRDDVSLTALGLAPGNAGITSTVSSAGGSRWEPLGMIGLFTGSKGNLELSYTLRVDVERVASSTSQIAIGLWF